MIWLVTAPRHDQGLALVIALALAGVVLALLIGVLLNAVLEWLVDPLPMYDRQGRPRPDYFEELGLLANRGRPWQIRLQRWWVRVRVLCQALTGHPREINVHIYLKERRK